MEGVLEIAVRAVDGVKAPGVGLIVGKEGLGVWLGVKVAFPEFVVEGQIVEALGVGIVGKKADGAFGRRAVRDDWWLAGRIGPRPDVAEPELRDDVEGSGFGAAVYGLDADAEVLR